MFLTRWNGRSMMEIHNPCWSPQVTFSSDASDRGSAVPCGRVNGSNASGTPRGHGKELL